MDAFLIMMSYFKAYRNQCELTHVIVESNLLATGSVNGFINGKYFIRCKRLHPLISLGLQILHVKQFLKIRKIIISESVKELKLLIYY